MDDRELELAYRRLDHETSAKDRELELKALELKQRDGELNHQSRRWLSPQQATVFVAVIGIVAAAIGAIVQGIMTQRLERERFRTSLILKAVETGDRRQASDNLLRLVEWNIIDDPGNQIANAIGKDPSRVPVLPPSAADTKTPSTDASAVGQVVQTQTAQSRTTVVKFDKNSSYTKPPMPAGDNGHELSVLLSAPGPIEDITFAAEGEGGPWTHHTRLDRISDTQTKWIGWSNSGAPAILVFTIKYRPVGNQQ